MDKITVAFLAEGENVPATRYRVQQFIPHLEKEGFRVRYYPSIPQKYWSPQTKSRFLNLLGFGLALVVKLLVRVVQSFLVRSADVVVIQRELLSYSLPHIEKLVARVNPKIVFDFDDSIFLYREEIKSPFFDKLLGEEKIPKTIALAKKVTVGNAYLADYAKQYSSHVEIIPTVIDTDTYIAAERREHDVITIGWMGTSGNLKYLAELIPTFTELSRTFGERVQLRIVTDTFRFQSEISDSISTEWIKWSADREIQDLQSFDIGIMPLADDKWTKGKCGFKIIQYMSTATVPVGSRVGANKEIVLEGKTGFLASSNDEWTKVLKKLIEDEQLRIRMGEAARERAEEHYSVRSQVKRLAQIYREVASGK